MANLACGPPEVDDAPQEWHAVCPVILAMQAMGDHLAIVIGASETAEELRRFLVCHGTPHAGAAGHLRGLRRGLLLGRPELVIVCVALNRATLSRHGQALSLLMADLKGFPSPIRSVGLVPRSTMTSRVAHLGCDVYVGSLDEATDVIRLLRKECSRDRVALRRTELLELWDEQGPISAIARPAIHERNSPVPPRVTGWSLWRPDQSADFTWSFRPTRIRRPAAGISNPEGSD